ncbi:hypothetical protein [Nostoc sp.]
MRIDHLKLLNYLDSECQQMEERCDGSANARSDRLTQLSVLESEYGD